MIRNFRLVLALALPVLAFALMPKAASAQSYNGNWPATVSKSKGANGTYCLTLTDNGSIGWPHSGLETKWTHFDESSGELSTGTS